MMKNSTLPPNQLLEGFVRFCERARDHGLTYIVVGRSDAEQADEYGPDYLAGLELASCATSGFPFQPPHPDLRSDSERPDCNQIVNIEAEITSWIEKLRSVSGLSFVICWNLPGSTEANLAASKEHDDDSIAAELQGLFRDLIAEYIL